MTTTTVPAEVAAFVDDVRAHLADLDTDTLDDLVGGLDADLADQLADGVPLGDPAAYAAELRAAAGLAPTPPPTRRRLDGPRGLGRAGMVALREPDRPLDAARAHLDRVVEHPRVRPAWDVVVALRPAWWLLRAWLAATMLDQATGPWEQPTLIPSLGAPGLGWLVLASAIVVSTLVGTGRLWPGGRRGWARVLVLAGNLALLGTVLFGAVHVDDATTLSSRYDGGYDEYSAGYDAARSEPLSNDGAPVTNVFVYDAAGRPVPRAQLVDQEGRPLDLRLAPDEAESTVDDDGTTTFAVTFPCPTLSGALVLRNVFPSAALRMTSTDDLPVDRCTRRDVADAVTPAFPLPGLTPLPAAPAPASPVTPVTPPGS